MSNRFLLKLLIAKWCLSAAFLAPLMSGCSREAKIEIHRVPKSRSGLEALRSPQTQMGENSSASQQSSTDRMVVGWLESDGATWFFKIVGPVDQVKQTESEWKSFFGAVKFDEGQPIWELPEGWRTGSERPMRFATLEFGEFEPPLELAVSSLSGNQDRLLNVNRWRGQLGLSKIKADELNDHLKELDSADNSVLVFDATGRSSGGMPPFARGPISNQPAGGQLPGATATADSELKFEVPDGWETGRTSSMVPVRLQTNKGEKTAQITVVRMSSAANTWAPNAKRWASEVGLGDMTAEDLKALSRDIEVDGHPAQLLDLSKEDSESSNTTIAGMIKLGETAWFLKLTGDKQLVVESESAFKDFLNSIQFPAN